jgi:SSS family solute:Na+ symporter
VLFILVIPGVAAILILPPLENGDRVFLALMGELLPGGLRGVVLAALASAFR